MYTNKTFAGSFTTPTELHSAKLVTALKINENQDTYPADDYESSLRLSKIKQIFLIYLHRDQSQWTFDRPTFTYITIF